MRETIKKCMLVYNVIALPFVFLTVLTFLPDTGFPARLSDWILNGFTVFYAALVLLLQNFLIPQIIAAILIGLYTYDVIRNRGFFPFHWERKSFLGLTAWTFFSALFIFLGCMAMADGRGEPLP